jgi:hypothetical protein
MSKRRFGNNAQDLVLREDECTLGCIGAYEIERDLDELCDSLRRICASSSLLSLLSPSFSEMPSLWAVCAICADHTRA